MQRYPITDLYKIYYILTFEVTTSAEDNPPTSTLTLLNPSGYPHALVRSSNLTPFRTALSSSCLLTRRTSIQNLVVFGSGLQAYWHIRLALKTRGAAIRKINIINHRFSPNAAGIMRRFAHIPLEVKQKEGWADVQFSMLTRAFHDYERLCTECLLEGDVIYCCTSSAEPLFDGGILTSHEGRRKGRLIVAVGSLSPETGELPVEIVQRATKKREKGSRHFHKHAEEAGVVVVDTLEGALKESGEIVKAGIGPTQLVEYVSPFNPLFELEADGRQIGRASYAPKVKDCRIRGKRKSELYADDIYF